MNIKPFTKIFPGLMIPAMTRLGCCAIPLLILCSCGKDVPKDTVDMGGGITFSVSTDNASTKTAFSGQGAADQQTGSLASERIDWVDGDLITIVSPQAKVKVGNQLVYSSDNPQYSTADYSVKTPSTEGETVSRATIEPVSGSGLRWGDGQHTFYALYPSSDSPEYTAAEKARVGITPAGFTGTIPTEQTPQWAGGGLPQMQYAYMTAPANASAGAASVDLPFSAQFTAFEFTVGAGEFPSVALTSFTLEALDADAAVTGDFTYAFADGAVTTSSSSNKITVDLTGKSVTSASGSTTAKTLTFTVLGLPVDMGAMRMTFTGDEIGERTLILKNKSGAEITFSARKKYRIGGIGFPLTGGGEDIIWDQEGFGEDILWDDEYLLEGTFASSLSTPYTGGDITLATDFRSCIVDGSEASPEPFVFQHSADGVNWTDGLPDWLSAPAVDLNGSATACELSLQVAPGATDQPRTAYVRALQPSSDNASEPCRILQNDFPLTITPVNGSATITIPNRNELTYRYIIDGEEFSSNNNPVDIKADKNQEVKLYQDQTVLIAQSIQFSDDCYVYGDVMSLAGFADACADGQFQNLFRGNVHLVSHPDWPIVLSATTMAHRCYERMFDGCTQLTTAPELPAEIMVSYCYAHMFTGCTKLTAAPALPAKTLAFACYWGMFDGCTRLTTAPAELPAPVLADICYSYMFADCSSLTTAPELPATSLALKCYQVMFYGCTSLTTAPALPATTLEPYCYGGMFTLCTGLTRAPYLPSEASATECYRRMFYGCTNLGHVECNLIDMSAENCLDDWLYGTAGSGTFKKNAAATWPTGQSGIPSSWTVSNLP